MRTILGLDDLGDVGPSAVTIGVFDGVHTGHQAIMRIVKAEAKAEDSLSVAVTFDRNPTELVNPDAQIPYITTLDQKLRLISEQEIDVAVVLPLDRQVLRMSAEEFVSVLLHDGLKARHVVVGADFAFGKGRAGDVRLLEEVGPWYGFGVTVVPPVRVQGIGVSSTVIRRLLSNGKIDLASEMLGHPFALAGRVIEGERLGRTLGYPTANVEPDPSQVLPPRGVYAVTVDLKGTRWIGVANIGNRPTFTGRGLGVEVYIIGFSGNIYGEQLEVAFHHHLRGETRFPNVDALVTQIGLDVEDASRLLG